MNYLGPFYFTQLLLDNIKASKEGRIVNVASVIHKIMNGKIDFNDLNHEKRLEFNGFNVYAKAKYCTILSTKQLALKLQKEGINNVKTVSLHPGVVNT